MLPLDVPCSRHTTDFLITEPSPSSVVSVVATEVTGFASFLLAAVSYHTIQVFNVDWKAECGQLNLAHMTENKKKIQKEETKRKCHCPLNLIQIHEVSPNLFVNRFLVFSSVQTDDLNKIDRGRWVIHDGMSYDQVQGQGHGGPKVAKMSNF